jgi:hypothetical protein
MKHILPNLFFFFLSSPILSPEIEGYTIYIHVIWALFDINYWKWINSILKKKHLKKKQFVSLFIFIGLISIVGASGIIFFRLFTLVLTVGYCVYCYTSNCFYLYRYMILNVLIALLQFILLMQNPELAHSIGPVNIARSIWGEYATIAYTNFFAISILPRVSGLCREGGFFAAYLVVVSFIAYFDMSLSKKHKKQFFVFLIIGIMISLSRSSLAILIVPIVLLLKKSIDKIDVVLMGIIMPIVASIIFTYIQDKYQFFFEVPNESVTLRFSGYAFVQYARLEDFIFGVDFVSFMDRIPEIRIKYDKYNFHGLPNIYLQYGVLSYLLFLVLMKKLYFSSTVFIVMFILSANVSLWTCDNFVILAWFLCIYITYNKMIFSNKNKILCQPA